MAQHGYVVFVIDNHGTPNRGKAFEDIIHRQCGQVEMKDQVKGIEWLNLSRGWMRIVSGFTVGVTVVS